MEPELRQQIIKVIEKVKYTSPNADIILTDAQEMKYKGKRTTVANQFSEMMYDLSIQYNAGFWSYYTVSGGKNAWRFWDAAKYTQGDGIHLNGVGSELKGTLLFNAIQNTISLIRKSNIASKPFEIITDTLTATDFDTIVVDTAITNNVEVVQQKATAVVKQNKTTKNLKKDESPSFMSLKRRTHLVELL